MLTAAAIMLVAANLRPAVVSVGPLADVISADLHIGSATVGLLTTLPVLFFGVVAPLAPRLAARAGIERTVLVALAVLVVGILIRSTPSLVMLMLGSAVIGAAIGVCNVILPALIKRDFAHRSGLLTGLYSMTLSGGAALAAGITVPVDDAWGGDWRLTLGAWSVVAAVTLLLWWPQTRRTHRMSAAPGVPQRLRTDRTAWAITVYMGAQSFIFYTFGAWLPSVLIERGQSAGQAGTTLALGQVVGLLMSLLAPVVAGRMRDQRPIAWATLAICAVGFVGLLSTHAAPLLWVCLIMVGPGAGISLALLFMVLRSSSTAQTGQVSGMAQSFGYLLAALGPLFIGAVHDVSGSWVLAMAVLALGVIPQGLAAAVAARPGRMGEA